MKERHRIALRNQNINRIPQIGDIVLIHSDKKNKLFWKLGKIIQLNYGRDKQIRSAKLKF